MKSTESSSTIATAAASESSMEDNTSDHRQTSPKSATLTTGATHLANSPLFSEGDGEPNFSNGGDPAVWAAFTENFRQVQSLLDQNRSLIQQVNDNHQSKMRENMVKNVALIKEINGNISKVASLYSNLSGNFSGMLDQRNASAADAKSNAGEKQ